MDIGSRFFWALITVLLGASVYFGVNAEQRRRAVQRIEASVETGDIVRILRVIDGDTLVVANPAGEHVALRILGIKAFPSSGKNDPTATIGQRAIEKVERTVENEPVRVLVHSTPRDRHGRTLASLFVNDKDLGLTLIQGGLVLVYTVYPFPSMHVYLQAQETARAKRSGLWADEDIAKRADLLLQQWKREAK